MMIHVFISSNSHLMHKELGWSCLFLSWVYFSDGICVFRSAPDIASLQITNPVRKTQSQPRSKSTKLPMATHLRKQESPATSSSSAGTSEGYDSTDFHSAEKSKSNSKLGLTGKTAVAVGSPKPKRNLFEGFKHTLRPGRGKGSDASSSRPKEKTSGGGSGGSLNSPTADEQPFSDMAATGSSVCSASTSRSNSEEHSPVRIS